MSAGDGWVGVRLVSTTSSEREISIPSRTRVTLLRVALDAVEVAEQVLDDPDVRRTSRSRMMRLELLGFEVTLSPVFDLLQYSVQHVAVG
jgi:hypothetical protein